MKELLQSQQALHNKINGLILSQKNREPVSVSLVNETIEEARSLMTTDFTSAADLEESLFDMSSITTTVKKPEKSPEYKYKLY